MAKPVRPSVRTLPCPIYRPSKFIRPNGIGRNDGDGTGGILYAQNVCFGRANLSTGMLRVHSDLHHPARSNVTRNGNGWHIHEIHHAVQHGPFPLYGTEPFRLKVRAEVTIERFNHELHRSTVLPPPFGSTVTWNNEFHVILPFETLKWSLGSRSISGATGLNRTVDIAAAGTTKTFTATSSGRYDPRGRILIPFGIWSEHRVWSRQIELDSICDIEFRVTELEVCFVR